MRLCNVSGDLAMNQQELLATAPGIDASAESTGR
jgi:hypothetical protein